jgi:hypothetical protein
MNPILAYFDLNNRPDDEQPSIRAESGIKELLEEDTVERLVPAADSREELLFTRRRTSSQLFLAPPTSSKGRKRASTQQFPLWQQGIFYLCTVLGVLFSNAVTQFRAETTLSITITVPIVFVAAVIGMAIMPYVYKHGIKRNSHLFVQLGAFVQAGVFCMVILTALSKPFS